MANTPIEIETMIRIEADEPARRFGPNCFDLRCVMASRGDTLSDTCWRCCAASIAADRSSPAPFAAFNHPEYR
jgi:hypothetical protein